MPIEVRCNESSQHDLSDEWGRLLIRPIYCAQVAGADIATAEVENGCSTYPHRTDDKCDGATQNFGPANAAQQHPMCSVRVNALCAGRITQSRPDLL